MSFAADVPTIKRLFNLLYDREPHDRDLKRLESHGVATSTSERQALRRVIASIDRQRLGTAFSIRFKEADLRMTEVDGFSLFFDETDVAVGRTFGAGAPYEPHLTQFFRQHIKPGMTVVDAGANIGYFSLLAARLVGEAGSVIACEPNTENCRLILLSLRRNGISHVRLLCFALGTELGSGCFTPAMGSNGTLQPDTDEILLGPNCTVVPVAPLDLLVTTPVDLIKMDVEGAEGNIVLGAQRILSRHRPIVTSEFQPEMLSRNSRLSPADLLGYFAARDYTIRLLVKDDPTGAFVDIVDPARFVADYGSQFRIEDLAFIPREKAAAG